MLPLLFLLLQPPVDLKLDSTLADECIHAWETKAPRWERIFASEAYQRLEKRETSMQRSFTQEEFKKWLLSSELSSQTAALKATLAAWKTRPLEPMARQALLYLPAQARIRATVYIVLKPRTNSFVFDTGTNPAIFLYLDPKDSPAQFANTVTHELHHIGLASVESLEKPYLMKLDPPARKAAEWMGAFGEGFAMLAAAGSPTVHPLANSPAADRERWDRDMTAFAGDLIAIETFLLDVADEEILDDAQIRAKAMEFFGVQGPWYTVGYKMAAVIELHKGRAELIACMTDPYRLIRTYNEVAPSEHLSMWSGEFVSALRPD